MAPLTGAASACATEPCSWRIARVPLPSDVFPPARLSSFEAISTKQSFLLATELCLADGIKLRNSRQSESSGSANPIRQVRSCPNVAK